MWIYVLSIIVSISFFFKITNQCDDISPSFSGIWVCLHSDKASIQNDDSGHVHGCSGLLVIYLYLKIEKIRGGNNVDTLSKFLSKMHFYRPNAWRVLYWSHA